MRVGSFRGTSGPEGTTSWPALRKNSRKLERISFKPDIADCYLFHVRSSQSFCIRRQLLPDKQKRPPGRGGRFFGVGGTPLRPPRGLGGTDSADCSIISDEAYSAASALRSSSLEASVIFAAIRPAFSRILRSI